ncbi:hypothetical protein VTN31DRAFT_5198 [Thermomyces dupontii]|uniref:uncharacterized protein n=1 Tax=Talaromyces thermophilus TaxID=28565 RepID=UPI0037443DC4
MIPPNDDAEWATEQGIPPVDDPAVQKYLDSRQALIDLEHDQRHDANFRKSMSPVVAKACQIVSHIRQKEQREVWSLDPNLDPDDQILTDEVFYPGAMFTTTKKRVQSTKLWRIVRQMPKGSLLHAHLEAMFDLDLLVDQAFSTPGIHMYAPAPLLTAEDFDRAPFLFRYAATSVEESSGTRSIWTADYTPSSLIPIQNAAATFPCGGEQGFRTWLKGRMMLSPDHAYRHHHGVDAIWRYFSRCFPIIGSLVFYEPIFRRCFRRLLAELAGDGIRYVDFRAAFVFEYRREGVEEPEKDYLEFFRVSKEEIDRFKTTPEGKRFYGARMIWTSLRFQSNREIADNMKQCILAKKAIPDMICGYDLVGQEDAGRPLVDLIPLLFWFRKLCVEAQVEIPFFFHAGECLGDGDSTDHNLFDAILLGTRRIGHGFSLFKHPLLIDTVKNKNILIECCPISNEILRLTGSIKQHPLPAMLSRGVSVSLCNDDPAVFGHGQNGLTHDFWQVVQGLENVGLSGLAVMAHNSILWSCYEDQSASEWQSEIRRGITGDGLKAQRLREWYAEFEEFCQWVVQEFGGEVDAKN